MSASAKARTEALPHWTESEVADKLSRRWSAPAWAFLRQVRSGVGFLHSNTADALAVQTWASRGLHIVGFEIKVQRGDWLRELRHPGKPEDIQQYCRYWYLATPAKNNVIEPGEVPETWGHVECSKRGTRIIKEAPKLKEQRPDMFLLASILRNAFRALVPADGVEDQINNEIANRTARWEKDRQYELNNLREAINVFESASGVQIRDEWTSAKIGQAVKLITSANGDLLGLARRLRDEHAKAAEGLDKMLSEIAAKEAEVPA